MTLKQCNKIATPHESNHILRTPKLTPNYPKLPKGNVTVAKTTENAQGEDNEKEDERGGKIILFVATTRNIGGNNTLEWINESSKKRDINR